MRGPTRKCGHAWEDRGKKGDCATCNRDRSRAHREKVRGGPPRQVDPERFRCGHPRSEGSPSAPSRCAPCHRSRERVRSRARYRADPEAAAARLKAWHEANPERARAHARAWRRRNPDYHRVRSYARDAEAQAWLSVLMADPCSYCGGPSEAVDHIKPQSRGGENDWSNFAPACRSCNSSKHDNELLHWLLARRGTNAEGSA